MSIMQQCYLHRNDDLRLGANDQIANILFMADGLLRSMLLLKNILDDLGKCYTENVIKHVKYQSGKKNKKDDWPIGKST